MSKFWIACQPFETKEGDKVEAGDVFIERSIAGRSMGYKRMRDSKGFLLGLITKADCVEFSTEDNDHYRTEFLATQSTVDGITKGDTFIDKGMDWWERRSDKKKFMDRQLDTAGIVRVIRFDEDLDRPFKGWTWGMRDQQLQAPYQIDTKRPYTIREARELLNRVPERLLDQPLIYWSDGAGGFAAMYALTEDFINPTGEVCEPVSIYTEQEIAELGTEAEVVLPKGSIIVDIEMLKEVKK